MDIKYSYDIKTGWFFLDANPWFLSLRIPSLQKFPIPSHCHQDFGSPIIYYKKQEVLIDLGRSSYLQESFFEANANNHSCILIDSITLSPCERDLGLGPNIPQNIKFKLYSLNKNIYFILRYPLSVNNQQKVKYVIRMIVFNNNYVEIIDRIGLKKQSLINTSFKFANDLSNFFLSFRYIADKSNSDPSLLAENSNLMLPTNRYIDYGNKLEAKYLKLEKKIINNFSSHLLIKKI